MGSARARIGELRREAKWRKWENDPIAFIEDVCKIRVPGKGTIAVELRDAQRETLRSVHAERLLIILKARQIGYSTLMALYSLWFAMFRPSVFVLFISRKEDSAKKLLKIASRAYKGLPAWVKERGPDLLVDNLQKLSFSNDSEIESQSSKDPARGDSVDLVVLDEWAFMENPDEAWSAAEPAADIGGRIVIVSTANGWGNLFHGMWVGARTGINGFKALFYSWRAVPERDDNWYAAKRAQFSGREHIFEQEYPSNEDEAFLKSGRSVFGLDKLREHEEANAVDPFEVGTFVEEHPRVFTWFPHGDGPYSVWERPQYGENYVIGADVAEGLEHGDYSSAHVIHTRTGRVVATYHAHIDADVYGEELDRLGRWYNNALLGVEKNNHGLTTLTSLKRCGYPRLYYRWTLDQQSNRKSKTLGWHTTQSNKALMIGELWAGVRDDEITVPCARTIAECKTYVRDEHGKMSGSPHDDRVMSLALAHQMRKHIFDIDAEPERNIEGTYGWWRQKLRDADAAARPTHRIGEHNVRGRVNSRAGR